MLGGETNSYPIQLMFAYWEYRPSALNARLDELIRRGVTHLTSFVPWQAFEADIHHSLARFLSAVAERKLTLSLVLTPEVGVPFPGSGIPRDLLANPELSAQCADQRPCRIAMPPLAYTLPSLHGGMFQKRYQNFMAKLDGVLAEQAKHHPWLERNLNLHLTGSFWKYYRSTRNEPSQAFFGTAGDFSGQASLQYRQRLEQWLAQKEFDDPYSGGNQRWRTRSMEDAHRRWFAQHSEEVFRRRSLQFFRRKCFALPVSHWELYAPEADPSLFRRSLMQGFSRGRGDFAGLSALTDAAAFRQSWVDGEPVQPWIHWTGISGFRSLSDSEKQFLILKSLFLTGSQGGGVVLEESEWFSLSAGFRARAELIARLLASGELRMPSRVAYLSSHLWSGEGALWQELQAQQGFALKWVAQASELEHDRALSLVIVDPETPITKDLLFDLLELARSGKLVAMANSPRFTGAAVETLERELAGGKALSLKMEMPYRIQPFGLGNIVLYDVLDNADEAAAAWKGFVRALVAVAGLPDLARASDGRLSLIELERPRASGGTALFILNGTAQPVSGELFFSEDVSVKDLPLRHSSPDAMREAEPIKSFEEEAADQAPRARRFGLEVPAFGILPLEISGQRASSEEGRAAALSSDVLQAGIRQAAISELPGFRDDGLPPGASSWN